MRQIAMIGTTLWLMAGWLMAGSALGQDQPAVVQHGKASYYGEELAGKPTATGQPFNPKSMTAASPSLPLGSKATVTNESNGRSVEVKINDRGPYVDGRVIDVSKAAAKKLGLEHPGVAPVTIEAKPAAQPTPALKEAVRQQAQDGAGEGSSAAPASGSK